MKKILSTILLSLVFCAASFGQIFPKDSLLHNGTRNQMINLVILPDGYTSAEFTKFKTDATAFMNYFFSQSPFSVYKNYFNVYTVNVPSNQSPQWDVVLILVNSTKYGGSGGTFPVASTDPSAAQVAVHEIGHSFGNLRDEYYPGASYMIEQANTSKESNSALVCWKNWLGINGTGIYQFSEDPTWHRPHQNCKMRYINSPFCPYCNELLIEKIHTITNAIYSYTPNPTTFSVTDEKIPLQFVIPSKKHPMFGLTYLA